MLISRGGYAEDYRVGQVVRHRRGHTVSQGDNGFLSLMTMNTAQTHFNEHSMLTYMDGDFPGAPLNACVALALAVGLTSQDMSEHSLGDLGYQGLTITRPLLVGDSVYATSTVLATDAPSPREDAGVLRYRIELARPDEDALLRVERSVLLKRRDAWLARDTALTTRVFGEH